MNKDLTEVKDETIRRIREKPEDERTGEEQAILGIDNAIESAKAEFEKAGFELDHLLVVFDARVSPDKNPEAPMMGMIVVPDHQECAMHMLAGAMNSVGEASPNFVKLDMSEVLGGGQPGQSGPIHRQ